jgi:phosphoribosylanthranilate isomerase
MITRIKICGITTVTDAVGVAALGADEIGLNFYPRSPRYVQVDDARRIAREIPAAVRKVGVFVNAEIDEVLKCADLVELDAIQLHGDESVEFVREVRRRSSRFTIKAVSAESAGLDIPRGLQADAILVDSPHGGKYGGTGLAFDWGMLGEVGGGTRIYLAGGLGPENVAEAIRRVRPFAVDACSRLESVKGRKNLDKVEDFIREVHQAL